MGIASTIRRSSHVMRTLAISQMDRPGVFALVLFARVRRFSHRVPESSPEVAIATCLYTSPNELSHTRQREADL